MASIRQEISIAREAAEVRDAVRDYGALHTRLMPGFVIATAVSGDPPVRRVEFVSGAVLDETIVTVDDTAMRLVWAIHGDGIDHHNGAVDVSAADAGCRVVWTADVLPHALADIFAPLMAAGLATMKTHLEGGD